MDKAEVVVCLKLISAKAEQLAQDIVNNKLWEGDLSQGLAIIREQLDRAAREAR